MIEFNSRFGHKIVEVSSDESNDLCWGNICDICSKKLIGIRYYIPVLNYGVCKNCMMSWSERAHFYSEDVPYERSSIYILKRSGLTYVVDEKMDLK